MKIYYKINYLNLRMLVKLSQNFNYSYQDIRKNDNRFNVVNLLRWSLTEMRNYLIKI